MRATVRSINGNPLVAEVRFPFSPFIFVIRYVLGILAFTDTQLSALVPDAAFPIEFAEADLLSPQGWDAAVGTASTS